VLTNPFPRQAVATYGHIIRTYVPLEYMTRPKEELDSYLRDHQIRERRYGGAIGLRGGHGSGKTHLLSWLGERARALTHTRPTVLYAKADSPRIFDLYRQLVPPGDRERVKDLIAQALKNMGREYSSRAKITESIKDRIDDPIEFSRLFDEGILDREHLFHMLRERLQKADVVRKDDAPQDANVPRPAGMPREIPLALLAVDSPTLGERAFAWFRGDDVGEFPELALTHPLANLRTAGESADPDVASINALEALAALHHLADVPLVILLDQFEVLLRADSQRQQTLFSVIKKLIEQVGNENALLFIAGSDESWQLLTRDVSPRLRVREPLRVGDLSEAETKIVLDAHAGRIAGFSDEAVKLIHHLSGGNIREALQIAHWAFEGTGGALQRVDEDVLLKGVEASGSVADQHRLALELADPVLEEQAGAAGKIVKDVAVAKDVRIDRLLYLGGSPVLAVVAVRATDKLSEVDSARRVSIVRSYLAERFPRTETIVIAVGYSSDEIRRILGTAVTTVVFSESTLQGLLRAETVGVIGRVQAAGGSVGGSDPMVLKALTELAARIEQIGVVRQREEEAAAERVVASAERLGAAAGEERALRTRWEMVGELDRLQAALARGDVSHERERIGALLVANETSLRDRPFDRLGGVYLDLVSLAPLLSNEASREKASSVRRNLITELRRVARGKRLIDRWLNAPLWVWPVIAIVAMLLIMFIILMDVSEYSRMERGIAYFLPGAVFTAVPASLALTGCAWAITALVRYWRVRRWEVALARLRRELD
jgi:hypothetical protein